MEKGNLCGYLKIRGKQTEISELPDKQDPIFSLIQEWSEYATRHPAEYYCPLKRVLVHFIYHDVYYVISPYDLKTDNNTFEDLVDDLMNDLVDLGCKDVFYGGMID